MLLHVSDVYTLLIGFVEHLQLAVTSGPKTLPSSCILLLATACSESLSVIVFISRSLITVPNNGAY
jgi:hypothetical protein